MYILPPLPRMKKAISQKLLFFLSLFFIFFIFSQQLASAIDINHQQNPQTFASNQIIVKFKQGQSPDEIKIEVAKREKEKKSFFGRIRIFIQDLKLKLEGKESMEEKLARLENVQNQIGIESKERLFKDTTSSINSNLYLYILDGSMSVLDAIELYKDLPEVESAQPNYIEKIQAR